MCAGTRSRSKHYSKESYRELVRLLVQEGYSTRPFTISKPEGKTVFLRHDIDYSLSWAADFAAINEESGVRGTFFVQLRSQLYNPFSPDSVKILEEIASRGQFIALHLALSAGHDEYGSVLELLRGDLATLRRAAPMCQPVFAWHNPGHFAGRQKELVTGDYPDFVNVYGRYAGGEYPYYADSNMRHSVAGLEEVVKKGMAVFQLALAPMQWMPGKSGMTAVLASAIRKKVRDVEGGFRENDVFRKNYPVGIGEGVLARFESEIVESAGSEPPESGM